MLLRQPQALELQIGEGAASPANSMSILSFEDDHDVACRFAEDLRYHRRGILEDLLAVIGGGLDIGLDNQGWHVPVVSLGWDRLVYSSRPFRIRRSEFGSA